MDVNLILQGLGTWLLTPMQFFSLLGTAPFYLFIAPALLWCLDAGLGLRIGLGLAVSASLNAILKLAFTRRARIGQRGRSGHCLRDLLRPPSGMHRTRWWCGACWQPGSKRPGPGSRPSC